MPRDILYPAYLKLAVLDIDVADGCHYVETCQPSDCGDIPVKF